MQVLVSRPRLFFSGWSQFVSCGVQEECGPLFLCFLQEQGLQGERTHVGLYTELGVLYATYESNKLMDYVRQHSGKVNIPRLIRACERQNLWKEAVYLHMNYDEFEQAANCLILHPTAWTHELFVQVLIPPERKGLSLVRASLVSTLRLLLRHENPHNL